MTKHFDALADGLVLATGLTVAQAHGILAAIVALTSPKPGASAPETDEQAPEVVREGPEDSEPSTWRACEREGCEATVNHWHMPSGTPLACSHPEPVSGCRAPRPEPDADPYLLITLRNAIATWRARTNPDDDLARLFDYHEDAARIIMCAADLVGEEGEPAEEYTPITAYLDRVQALTDAATPGPWEWDPPSDANWPIGDENLWSTATDPREPVVTSWGYDADGIEAAPENRAFIAAARTDVEVMTKALRAVTAATEGVELQPEDGPATRGWKSALIQMRSLVEEAIPGE